MEASSSFPVMYENLSDEELRKHTNEITCEFLAKNGETEYTNLPVSTDHGKYDYTILRNIFPTETADGDNIEIPIFADLNETEIVCLEIPNMEKIKHAIDDNKITSNNVRIYYNKLIDTGKITLDTCREINGDTTVETLTSGFVNYNNILKSINPDVSNVDKLITDGISANPVIYRVKEPNVYKKRIGRMYGSSLFNYLSNIKNTEKPTNINEYKSLNINTSKRITNVQQIH
jgi:hypothetical protein